MTDINGLIAKYYSGKTNSEEEQILVGYFENKEVAPELESYKDEFLFLASMQSSKMSPELESKIVDKLEKKKLKRPIFHSIYNKAAAIAFLMAASFIGGHFSTRMNHTQLESMQQEISDLRQLMVSTMIDQNSTHHRLMAVAMASEMQQITEDLADQLFQTVNTDKNINIRLAATNALIGYDNTDRIKEELLLSIVHQESALVQQALLDLLTAIHGKSIINDLENIMKNPGSEKDLQEILIRTIDNLKTQQI